MLPPFIIEQIRKREEERTREGVQPQLEIEIERPRAPTPKADAPPDSTNDGRSIIILEL